MGERAEAGLLRLQAGNPWLDLFGDDPIALAARIRRDDMAWRQAALAARNARIGAGRDVWNAWALDLLACRSEVAATPSLAGIWSALARCELDDDIPGGGQDFSAWLFPGDVALSRNRDRPLALDHAAVMGDILAGGVRFAAAFTLERAHVRGDLTLRGAVLSGGMRGYGLRVDGGADLTRADVLGDIWVRGGSRFGSLLADHARFAGEAAFGDAVIGGRAQFEAAHFERGAGFGGTLFSDTADFTGARFMALADFAEAQFQVVPCFDRARFSGALRFANARFPSEDAALAMTALAARVSRRA
jgi:hypothetical protein